MVLARINNWQPNRSGGKTQGFEIIPIWAEIPNSAGMHSVWLWMCGLMSKSLCFFTCEVEIHKNTFSVHYTENRTRQGREAGR